MSVTNRAVLGGCALGLATGWNVANTGAVAQQLADAYGVGLATVGLFTTALFVTHLVMQIPGGRASDRFGVPRFEGTLGWRAPFTTAICVAVGGLLVLALGPADTDRRSAHARVEPARRGVLGDRQLYPLAVLYGASLGLSIVLGNWVATLLHRQGGLDKATAGSIGALTLVLGIVTRPLGGWILHTRPARARAAVGASLLGGAVGTVLLITATTAVATLGAVLVGLAAGIPFAPAFTGAALARPDAQAAAVGLVNGAASVVVLVGTPLVGLSFSLPGGGRAGFAVIAALWLGAFLVLPSRARLGVSAMSGSESPAG